MPLDWKVALLEDPMTAHEPILGSMPYAVCRMPYECNRRRQK